MSHTQTFNLTGVKCQGCVAKVSESLEAVPQVESFSLDLAAALLTVTYKDQADERAIISAVAGAGKYSAQPASI